MPWSRRRRFSLSSRRRLCLELIPGGRTAQTIRCREHATRQTDRCALRSPWVYSVDKNRWRPDEPDPLGFFLGVDNPTVHRHVPVLACEPIEQAVSDTPVRAAVEVEQRDFHARHRRSQHARRTPVLGIGVGVGEVQLIGRADVYGPAVAVADQIGRGAQPVTQTEIRRRGGDCRAIWRTSGCSTR